jgi:hypothetical protein
MISTKYLQAKEGRKGTGNRRKKRIKERGKKGGRRKKREDYFSQCKFWARKRSRWR